MQAEVTGKLDVLEAAAALPDEVEEAPLAEDDDADAVKIKSMATVGDPRGLREAVLESAAVRRPGEDMLSIAATDEWRSAHPGATIGLLELSGIQQARPLARLEKQKRETEAQLRERYQGFTRQDFLALPVMAAYEQYYKRFHKTYHVQLQVESIVLKGKDLPDVSPLVDANFTAEVETLVLTAGHDVAKLRGAVSMDVSAKGDQMTLMNGAPKAIYAGDMIMRDAGGICCSIIYGQDNRSPISVETSQALYVSYAPAGVPPELVEVQLRKIEENIRLFSPAAVVEQLRLLKAPAA